MGDDVTDSWVQAVKDFNDKHGRWPSTIPVKPGTWASGIPAAPPPRVDPITEAQDHVLVMELISRGYAVAKMSPDELVEASK